MSDGNKLYLSFHGRIIDSLGIQMYESPVAAIAELIANSWDADAKLVKVMLPENLNGSPEISISDNGHGMTFDECQRHYLSVGRNRRNETSSDTSKGGRPVLGRKGIGKFAGFGIAELLEVHSISQETGEETKFSLDLTSLRGDDYMGTTPKEVPVHIKEPADPSKKAKHGTKITLKNLKLSRTPSQAVFGRSMARRFLLTQSADEFAVTINGAPLPDDDELVGVEFDFPTDYRKTERPEGITIDDGWGIEKIGGDEVRWRIKFTKETISTEELRGVSVFCGIKVAQTPFFFNLSGGLSGQHGQQYMSGEIKADYIDQLGPDIITTERQRISWENPDAQPLLLWGQAKVKQLLSIWKERRSEEKLAMIESKVAQFSYRLDRLSPSERKTVKGALKKLATVSTLTDGQFESLSGSILTAWEGGRLRELISEVSDVEDMSEGVLLTLLAEAEVLNALHVAEAVRAKLDIIRGLRRRIEEKELENAVRDYIAENPWLLSPEWDTFKIESSVRNLIKEAAKEAKLESDPDWNKRIDLVLSSNKHLLIVEFMRPGKTVDRDHLNRYQLYMDIVREKVEASTELGFETVSGLLVAEKLSTLTGVSKLLDRLKDDNMLAIEWDGLLARAEAQWSEFLDVLVDRAPNDERLETLKAPSTQKNCAAENKTAGA